MNLLEIVVAVGLLAYAAGIFTMLLTRFWRVDSADAIPPELMPVDVAVPPPPPRLAPGQINSPYAPKKPRIAKPIPIDRIQRWTISTQPVPAPLPPAPPTQGLPSVDWGKK